ncbi:Transmembrane protein [Phytophthora palmivora]|uniref:Transmembrane protein n=1 Tax=Phytophthora palmivora TaxID=4796 RepID=A0A2P4YR92_9STRA|nr:Transmembrane protein [Phytophthora palmivora]
MITIGTLYNAVAMILPMWTANSTVNSALTTDMIKDITVIVFSYRDVAKCLGNSDLHVEHEDDKFLDKSCGLLGMATMTFGGMSMSNGLMAIISIVGAIT